MFQQKDNDILHYWDSKQELHILLAVSQLCGLLYENILTSARFKVREPVNRLDIEKKLKHNAKKIVKIILSSTVEDF